jgi:hypothetical protein
MRPMRRVLNIFGVAVAIVLSSVLILFGAIMIDWSRSSARAEKDVVITQARSPDNQFVAEIHLLATAMHGGPDRVYVIIKGIGTPLSEKIYERTYECDDVSAYRLTWDGPRNLTMNYGNCDAGAGNAKSSDFDHQQQNKVWRSETTWGPVKVSYKDTNQVATH